MAVCGGSGLPNLSKGFTWQQMLAGLFMLPFVIIGLLPLGLGLLCGALAIASVLGLPVPRGRVGLFGDRLLIQVRWGLLRWTWRLRRDHVRAIWLRDGSQSGLSIPLDRVEPLVALRGYAREVLAELVRQLRAELGLAARATKERSTASASATELPSGADAVPSRLRVEAQGESVVIHRQPQGFLATPIWFAVPWLLIAAAMSVAMVMAWWSGAALNSGVERSAPAASPTNLWSLAMLLPFWAIGMVLVLISVQMARRRVAWVLAPGVLHQIIAGPLRQSRRQWPIVQGMSVDWQQRSDGDGGTHISVSIEQANGSRATLVDPGDDASRDWLTQRVRSYYGGLVGRSAPITNGKAQHPRPVLVEPDAAQELPPDSPLHWSALGDRAQIDWPGPSLGEQAFHLIFVAIGAAAAVVLYVLSIHQDWPIWGRCVGGVGAALAATLAVLVLGAWRRCRARPRQALLAADGLSLCHRDGRVELFAWDRLGPFQVVWAQFSVNERHLLCVQSVVAGQRHP
jgi:hypothetical protein